MKDEQLAALIAEMRADYQLPPYFQDEVIKRALKECLDRLGKLNPVSDFQTDLTGRGLLKNNAYYVIYHKADEFMKNYSQDILSWQLSAEVV